jgi:hypothetical protein
MQTLGRKEPTEGHARGRLAEQPVKNFRHVKRKPAVKSGLHDQWTAKAPPSSVMNSRRLITRSARRRFAADVQECLGPAPLCEMKENRRPVMMHEAGEGTED